MRTKALIWADRNNIIFGGRTVNQSDQFIYICRCMSQIEVVQRRTGARWAYRFTIAGLYGGIVSQHNSIGLNPHVMIKNPNCGAP